METSSLFSTWIWKERECPWKIKGVSNFFFLCRTSIFISLKIIAIFLILLVFSSDCTISPNSPKSSSNLKSGRLNKRDPGELLFPHLSLNEPSPTSVNVPRYQTKPHLPLLHVCASLLRISPITFRCRCVRSPPGPLGGSPAAWKVNRFPALLVQPTATVRASLSYVVDVHHVCPSEKYRNLIVFT